MIINMIYADGCPQCLSMKQSIKSMSKFLNIDIDLKLYNCESEEAIDIAIEYGIEDVPGCNIGGKVVQGEKYSNDDILAALKALK